MTFPFPIISPRSQTWVSSFSYTLADGSPSAGYTDYALRQAIPASAISTSGSTIRVTIKGNATVTSQYDNISIVERSPGTVNGVTTPTELKFSGVSGVTIAAGAEAVSDPLVFSIDETKPYFIHFDVASVNGAFQRHATAGDDAYYKVATNDWNTQSPTGYTLITPYMFGVSKIEVLA